MCGWLSARKTSCPKKFASQEIIGGGGGGGVSKITKREIRTIRIGNLYAFTQDWVIS